MAPGLDDVGRLLAIEELKMLHARYLRCLDDRLVDEIRDVFTADARMHASSRSFDDIEEFFAFLAASSNRPRWTIHHGHMPEITLHSERDASVMWQLAAHGAWDDGGASDGGGGLRVVAMFGRYEGRARREEDGAWRYCELRLTMSPLRATYPSQLSPT
jgi:hypothetical protein